MTRTSSSAALTLSTMAAILILNYVLQPATSFVLLSPAVPMSTSSTIQSCFHRSPLLARGSHIINRGMPLHSSVKENAEEKDTLEAVAAAILPTQDRNGIYDISTKEDHLALLANNPGKIIIMKAHAPWCQTCKRLAPKFVQLSRDPKYTNLPVIFAQMNVQHNKDYIRSLGTHALPSVLIHVGREGIVENFPCTPKKISILKNKIAKIINSRVDAKTLKLKKRRRLILRWKRRKTQI